MVSTDGAKSLYSDLMRSADSHQPGDASEAELQLLSDLELESLRSERLRATIIATFSGIGGLMFLTVEHFFAEQVEPFRLHRGFGTHVAMAMAFLLCCELVLRAVISRRIARGTPGSGLVWRYASAALELTVPTAMTLLFMNLMHSVNGLLMPPTSLYFFFVMVSALRMDFGVCLFTGILAAAEYLLLYYYGRSHYDDASSMVLLVTPFHHVAKALGFIICGVAAGVITTQLKQRVTRSVRLLAERNRINTMFGLYVSPSVVNQLMERPSDMEGELRNVCVLFLDIRNFTQFSEKRSPQEVVQYLNGLFSFMIDIIGRHQGIINKFLGDGFMAVFGAPIADEQACEHAMRAALEIGAQLEHEVAAGRLPPTRTGIGIHYGPALTGSIGSSRRKEYTLIGDTVNLASRIEALTKQHDAQILVSHHVIQAAASANIKAQSIGEVAVRGREAPLALYKLA